MITEAGPMRSQKSHAGLSAFSPTFSSEHKSNRVFFFFYSRPQSSERLSPGIPSSSSVVSGLLVPRALPTPPSFGD